MDNKNYLFSAINLLRELVEIPSISKEEDVAASLLEKRIKSYGFKVSREVNNVWTQNDDFDKEKPTILLNAHIDTVKPNESWKRNPYSSGNQEDIIYGLGSNDCGGGLVCLLEAFRYLTSISQSYNIVYLASAEEEISGVNGFRRVLKLLPKIDFAIVGEPTRMQPAIAERGLMVVDAVAKGVSSHVANQGGQNAIYKAIQDITWIKNYKFDKQSELLGQTQMMVTLIQAGTQHNVIPDECHFTIDVRTNENYTNEEVFSILSKNLKSQIKARSFHLLSSRIDESSPIVQRLIKMGKKPYGSRTLSDQALMPFASIKLGPGDSLRSHRADEYILVSEIEDAIKTYIELLDGFKF